MGSIVLDAAFIIIVIQQLVVFSRHHLKQKQREVLGTADIDQQISVFFQDLFQLVFIVDQFDEVDLCLGIIFADHFPDRSDRFFRNVMMVDKEDLIHFHGQSTDDVIERIDIIIYSKQLTHFRSSFCCPAP